MTIDLRAQVEEVNLERRRIKDALDFERDRARKPLTDWENTEKERKEAHQAKIEHIRGFEEAWKVGQDSEFLENQVGYLSEIIVDESYEEFEQQARELQDSILPKLKDALKMAKERDEIEKEKAKIKAENDERERKERDEKIKKEAAEKAKKEAEDKAEGEKLKLLREKAEAEVKAKSEKEEREAAIEKAKQDKIEAEKKTELDRQEAIRKAEEEKQRAIESERQRIADEESEKQYADDKRAADKAHVNKIDSQAVKGLIAAGFDEATARKLILTVKLGKVPNMIIKY